DQEALRAARQRLPRRDCVIAYDIDLSTQFHQVMDQVEGEAVVVVDDEDHGAAYCPNPGSAAMRAASRAAASSAAALASHSRCSSAGSLSATMPAPAWTCITPSFTTAVLSTMQLSTEPSGAK